MAVQKNKSIENQTIILDGSEFDHCELRDCTLVFKGQEQVKLEHCRISGCTWEFEDAALRTVMMLKGLWQSGNAGKEIVETIFRNV